MGLVYLPTFGSFLWCEPNVGRYTIHGWYGSDDDWGVQSPPKRKVFRFPYHSEGDWIPRDGLILFVVFICVQ